MLYNTIILELIQQRPKMHELLRKNGLLLATLNRIAKELKASHREIMEQLIQANPDCNPGMIASQALEMALAELEARLLSES